MPHCPPCIKRKVWPSRLENHPTARAILYYNFSLGLVTQPWPGELTWPGRTVQACQENGKLCSAKSCSAGLLLSGMWGWETLLGWNRGLSLATHVGFTTRVSQALPFLQLNFKRVLCIVWISQWGVGEREQLWVSSPPSSSWELNMRAKCLLFWSYYWQPMQNVPFHDK